MYSISKYKFEEFKITPGHRANYAILCNPEFKEKQWGLKYHPSNDYTREFKILSEFSHPQIPTRFQVGREIMYKKDKFVLAQHFLIMTHFEGEDIVEYYKKKDLPNHAEIDRLLRYFSSASLPLQHMHSKGYIHCDIKPGHFILNPETESMSLIDLECAIKIGDTLCGMSKEYASPEQKQLIHSLRRLADNKDEKSVVKKLQMNAASDLYSVGLIFYQVLTGKLWQDEPVQPQEINHAVPEKLNKTILGLLEENPINRISSAEKLKTELESV